MLCVAQRTTDRSDETENEQQEHDCQRTYDCHSGREDGVRLKPFVVGKTEECRLHTKGQQHQDQCHIGIDVSADAIVARVLGHIVRVEWHEQVVQESAYDATQSIDSCIFCK